MLALKRWANFGHVGREERSPIAPGALALTRASEPLPNLLVRGGGEAGRGLVVSEYMVREALSRPAMSRDPVVDRKAHGPRRNGSSQAATPMAFAGPMTR